MMDIKKIPTILCHDLVSEVHEVAGKTCIVTPMTYPNGDSINIYFGSSGDAVWASDEGQTVDYLAQRGIKVAGDRLEVVETICRNRGTSFSAPRILKDVKRKSIVDDFLSLCQTITHVSSSHYHVGRQQRSEFPEVIDKLVRRKIERIRNVNREWSDPTVDPKGSFPVDYHLNGEGPPRNIFYVTSGMKALLVTAVVHFLLSHDIDIPTLAVVDDEAGLKGKQLDRLQFASTKILFGIKGNERNIVNFALGKAA